MARENQLAPAAAGAPPLRAVNSEVPSVWAGLPMPAGIAEPRALPGVAAMVARDRRECDGDALNAATGSA